MQQTNTNGCGTLVLALNTKSKYCYLLMIYYYKSEKVLGLQKPKSPIKKLNKTDDIFLANDTIFFKKIAKF